MSFPLLLDLDGTLVDATGDLLYAVNALRAEHGGEPLDRAAVHALIGPGRRYLVHGATQDLELDLDAALVRFAEHLRTHEPRGTVVLDGIHPALRTLAQHHPLAVVTNKPQENADRVVDGLGLRPPVRVVVGPQPGRANKPDPQMLVEALHALGAPSTGAVMVGDAVSDLLAGQAAGLRTLGVTWGLASAAELQAARPDALVDTPRALVDVIAGWRG